jgi:hypothetical protein
MIHKAVVEKIKNEKYDLSKNLDFRSAAKAKQLYTLFKDKNPGEVATYFQEQRENSNFKIDQFIEITLNEKVIPLEKINKELVNKLHDYIENHSDCKILASALQLQAIEDRPSFLFVTADNHFSPNEYDFLKEQFEINYPEENWKFPELLNLLFNN